MNIKIAGALFIISSGVLSVCSIKKKYNIQLKESDISIHFVNNTVLCHEKGEFVNAAC